MNSIRDFALGFLAALVLVWTFGGEAPQTVRVVWVDLGTPGISDTFGEDQDGFDHSGSYEDLQPSEQR